MVQATATPASLASLLEELIALQAGSALTNEGVDLEAGLREATTQILELRAVLRERCEATETLREEAAAAKTRLDESGLVLKNLAYEKDHHAKETAACRAFKWVDGIGGESAGGWPGGCPLGTVLEGSSHCQPARVWMERMQHARCWSGRGVASCTQLGTPRVSPAAARPGPSPNATPGPNSQTRSWSSSPWRSSGTPGGLLTRMRTRTGSC